MAWPDIILRVFASVPRDSTRESDYYAPYNALLGYLFPLSEGYIVSPQHVEPDNRDAIDMTLLYLIELKRYVVFFLEIKPAGHIKHMSTRASADAQMRQRYRRLFESSAPTLHGASALGTQLCFYEFDHATRRIRPASIAEDPERMTDTAPAEWWDTDVLTEEGEGRLRSVALEVKSIASSLQPDT
jgi:hypothetical protein